MKIKFAFNPQKDLLQSPRGKKQNKKIIKVSDSGIVQIFSDEEITFYN